MPSRERRNERAGWLVRRDLEEVGRDLRSARLMAGLTLHEVGMAIGCSPQTVLRHERLTPGRLPDPERLARHAAAVGMRLRFRVYPEGEPLRDAAQVELIRQFRARLPELKGIRFEVPIAADPVDRRAWDAVIDVPDCSCALEFVTRFHDCQAQLRAFQLKLRDGGVDRLIVVVRASHANRRALAAVRDVIEAEFPLGTRSVMAALAEGRDPGRNGLVLL